MSTPIDMIIDSGLSASGDRAGGPSSGPSEPLGTTDESLTESGFYWRERGGLKALVCGPLEEAGFANGFSTRLGGVSPMPAGDLNLAGFGEDTDANIHENRRRFLTLFDGEYSLATVWQTHGDNIKIAKTRALAAAAEDKADAVASNLSGFLAGVKTADCVPVLIGDPKTNAFAAVHAGWRGTVRSIVQKTISAMAREFGTEPAGLICAIGPAASGRSYEVGPDVIDEFGRHFSTSGKYFSPTRDGHALVDLHLANRDQLIAAGVAEENIFSAPFCTILHTDLFFSYRIEKKRFGKTGRLLSVIGLSRRGEAND